MLSKIKSKQVVLLYGVIGALGIIIVALTVIVMSKKAPSVVPKADKKILTGTARINPQEVWVHNFSPEVALTQKRIEALEGTLEKLLQINNTRAFDPPSGTCNAKPYAVDDLRQEVAKNMEEPKTSQSPASWLSQPSVGPMESGKGAFKSKALQKVSISLNSNRSNKPLKTTDNTIPAGAFAKAVLLGGVDASTSIQASNDPRPILLRLTNPGTLPRKFRSDLEGCHALAACYGDISSERVFMRLEKLTCIERKTGEVVEMNVQGYVAGEDGRAGLRGRLVDRAGESMRNAMVGGFISSVGNFLGQSRTPVLFSPATGLAQNHPLSTSDILKQSTATGVSGALDKYAEFYIKRAEQMQPVIQVAAGRKADIVFTQGTEFTDSSLRQAVSRINDQKRYQQVQSMEETKPVGEWLSTKEGGNK